MDFKRFLQLQFAAFVFFGLALMLVPTPFLEGVYQVDDAGDTAWVRLFGATLLGVGYMEWTLLAHFEGTTPMARSFVAVPALLTLALLYTLVAGTEVFNAFFNWSSLVITVFFTAGHLWFARESQGAPAAA